MADIKKSLKLLLTTVVKSFSGVLKFKYRKVCQIVGN
jgi:hypothetical protein